MSLSRIVKRGLFLLAGAPAFFAQGQESSQEILVTSQKLEASIPALLEQQGIRIDHVTAGEIASHFVVYINGDTSDGYKPFRDQDFQSSATQRDRSYRVFATGAKYAYDVTDSLRVSATFQDSQAKLDDTQTRLVANSYNERSENIATAKIDYTPSDQFQLFAKGYYHAWDSHFTEFENVIGSPGALKTDDDRDYWGYHDTGANLMARIAATPWVDAIIGYDYQAYSGRDAVLAIAQKSEDVNAVFGQLATSSNLSSKGTLAVGFRFNAPSVGESATVWTVSGKYDITPGLFVRASGGTSFRLPTAEELFANDPEDERGNPDLESEQTGLGSGQVDSTDGTGARYTTWNLAPPLTAHIRYSYRF